MNRPMGFIQRGYKNAHGAYKFHTQYTHPLTVKVRRSDEFWQNFYLAFYYE